MAASLEHTSRDTGRVLSTNSKYDDATKIDLPAWSRQSLNLPLRIENDARMALLREFYAGAAKGFTDVVMMTLGTGIGGGVMRSADLIIPYVQSYVQKHAWTPWGKVQVRAAALGNNAALFGANPLLCEN